MARIFSSLQQLVAVLSLLWVNLVLSNLAPTPVNLRDSRSIEINQHNVEDRRLAFRTDITVTQAAARAALVRDLRQRATATTSAAATESSKAGGLDSIITGFVDAFSCVGNVSDLFAGFENLLGGLGADTTFISAIEDVLFGNFTSFEVPAFFLGIGMGEGAIVGLNATTTEQAKVYADNAAAAAGGTASGLNGISKEFGRGLVNVTLPAVLNSNAENFLAGLNLSELVAGAGIGVADGIGTALKPILGKTVFEVTVNNTGNFTDPKGAGAVTYSFARGLASQLTNLGLGFLGIGNISTISSSQSKSTTKRDVGANVIEQDKAIRSFLGHTRGIILPDQNSKFESFDPLLLNSSKTDQITSSLAQSAVSELSCKGVGGAVSLFSSLLSDSNSPVPSLPNLGDMKLPDIHVLVRNDGNLFEIGLKDMSAAVNGIPLNKLIGLIAGHIVLTLAAFLTLFPTLLILGAIERLAIAIGKPIDPAKFNRWIIILQVGLLPLLAIAGLVLGILSAGSSRNFRSAHGILGLILVAISFISSVLSCAHRRRPSKSLSRPSKQSRLIGMIDSLVNVLMMGLIFATWITGLEDLRTLSLCIVDQVSMTIMATVASIINGLWDSAVTIIAVEWWLGRRVSKTGPSDERISLGSGGENSSKEGRTRHVDVAR